MTNRYEVFKHRFRENLLDHFEKSRGKIDRSPESVNYQLAEAIAEALWECKVFFRD